jgi:putative glycosyltransferase
MRISVVTTLYHSAPYLGDFCRRMAAALTRLTDDYEIVLVNDGSPDDALAIALDLHQADDRVKVIDLSRNFGHHAAMVTGLRYAGGDLVFLIDCDLEEDPELLHPFAEMMRTTGADVVFGVQDVRRGGPVKRLSGRLYYKVVNWLARDPLPENVMTVRLMSRRYVDALLQHPEVELNIAGLWVRTGFAQVAVPVTRKTRSGTSYSLARKLAMLVNAITSMSAQPLVFIFYLGTLISALSVGAAVFVVIRRLFFGEMLAGWPSLIVSIWFIGGLMIFCQGVIGIYVAKVLMESKRRPLAIIRAIHDRRCAAGINGAAQIVGDSKDLAARAQSSESLHKGT